MKKEELKKLLWDSRNQNYRLIAVFSATCMPKLRVVNTPGIIHRLDLEIFLEKFQNLEKDECFVFGKLPVCDHRIGYKTTEYLLKDTDSENDVENYYMQKVNVISDIQCFVENNFDGTFNLYDCSASGTCIMLTET